MMFKYTKVVADMTDKERFQKQIDFCLEIDKEKQIFRQTPVSDGTRKENDAEHAWHMAIMTLILGEYANEPIDKFRTMSMLLVHDLIEIYSGDTFAYDEEAKLDQAKRELEAADRLFAMLPEDQAKEMRGLWEEFEARQTPEAKFARTMDNFQPTMLNRATGGMSWTEHKVKLSQVLERNSYTADGSAKLWNYSKENYLKPSVAEGKIIADTDFKDA